LSTEFGQIKTIQIHTTIKYSIPNNVETLHATSVQLKIYDILGKEIAILVTKKTISRKL